MYECASLLTPPHFPHKGLPDFIMAVHLFLPRRTTVKGSVMLLMMQRTLTQYPTSSRSDMTFFQRSILMYCERILIVLRIHVFQSCILMYPIHIPEYIRIHENTSAIHMTYSALLEYVRIRCIIIFRHVQLIGLGMCVTKRIRSGWGGYIYKDSASLDSSRVTVRQIKYSNIRTR
jgi:hypothetical protein